MLAQILEAWLRFSKLLGAAHHSSSHPSLSQPASAVLNKWGNRNSLAYHHHLFKDINGFCVPGQQHICLLSPHKTSRVDSSCLGAAAQRPESTTLAVRPASLQGSILCWKRNSFAFLRNQKQGICVPKKQHIYVLSSERLDSDPSSCWEQPTTPAVRPEGCQCRAWHVRKQE